MVSRHLRASRSAALLVLTVLLALAGGAAPARAQNVRIGFIDSQPIPHDDELSSLLEQAQSLRSRDARLELYRAADRRLVADCVWAVPIVYDMWNVLHRPNVEGIWTHPLGIGVLDEVVVHHGARIGGS